MFFLLLAIISTSLISVIMRISSDKVKGKLSMLAANYFVCSVLGAIYAGLNFTAEQSNFSSPAVFGIINGFLYLISFILLQHNTDKHGIVLSSIFMKLGLLVPIIISVLFFHEIPSILQISGFIISVASIILININKSKKTLSFGVGLILLLLSGGSADAMSKIYESLGRAELSDQFLFFTFLTALILCMILVLIKREKTSYKDLLFGAVIGIPNFFSSKFLLASLNTMPAVVAYPTFSVASILIVTVIGIIIFKEKLVKTQWIALTGIISALILLNI